MEEHDERRKEARKKVMKFTPVYDQNTNALVGYLRDLTLQGALVIGEKKLEIDQIITLGIDLPGDLPKVTIKRLKISARVAHCVEDESPNLYKLGFQFKNVTTEHKKILDALLERYHFRHKIYDWLDPGKI
jgi:c-di-GMP-binding flagellar brake protein YcgR